MGVLWTCVGNFQSDNKACYINWLYLWQKRSLSRWGQSSTFFPSKFCRNKAVLRLYNIWDFRPLCNCFIWRHQSLALYHCFNSHIVRHSLDSYYFRTTYSNRHFFCNYTCMALVQIKNDICFSLIKLFAVHQASRIHDLYLPCLWTHREYRPSGPHYYGRKIALPSINVWERRLPMLEHYRVIRWN